MNMNLAHLHLLLNHFPIIGTLIGAGIFVASFIRRNNDLKLAGLTVFAGMALLTLPAFFSGVDSAFTFLASIDGHIHVEVRKLYPDAELPRFECRMLGPSQMEMIYTSSRPFADLAEGLIVGCAKHFGQPMTIERSTGAA